MNGHTQIEALNNSPLSQAAAKLIDATRTDTLYLAQLADQAVCMLTTRMTDLPTELTDEQLSIMQDMMGAWERDPAWYRMATQPLDPELTLDCEVETMLAMLADNQLDGMEKMIQLTEMIAANLDANGFDSQPSLRE